jgi:hypothetical protein
LNFLVDPTRSKDKNGNLAEDQMFDDLEEMLGVQTNDPFKAKA